MLIVHLTEPVKVGLDTPMRYYLDYANYVGGTTSLTMVSWMV